MYEFDGRVIRLNKSDFDRWQKSFGALDLRSELQALDDWLAESDETKNWFMKVSAILNKKNREVIANNYDDPFDGGHPGAGG